MARDALEKRTPSVVLVVLLLVGPTILACTRCVGERRQAGNMGWLELCNALMSYAGSSTVQYIINRKSVLFNPPSSCHYISPIQPSITLVVAPTYLNRPPPSPIAPSRWIDDTYELCVLYTRPVSQPTATQHTAMSGGITEHRPCGWERRWSPELDMAQTVVNNFYMLDFGSHGCLIVLTHKTTHHPTHQP